ncbi:hypothetical protein ACIRRH_33595 [Kitasatospora sp. NPDC101235]|uniref:hypothetical protein n=1 Tax=Kitasatospora sp. NPDC101235 TaxID=3364101 RepID=UPI00380CE4CB
MSALPGNDDTADITISRNAHTGTVSATPSAMAFRIADALLPQLGFVPAPAALGSFRLTAPRRGSRERAVAAVRALRTMGHRVLTDPEFDTCAAARPGNADEPDVAIGRHPKLGIVAAVADDLPINPAPLLTRTGWQHVPALDLYRAPATDRPEDDGLPAVARATARLRRSRYTVAVQPDLVAAILARKAEPAVQQHRH